MSKKVSCPVCKKEFINVSEHQKKSHDTFVINIDYKHSWCPSRAAVNVSYRHHSGASDGQAQFWRVGNDETTSWTDFVFDVFVETFLYIRFTGKLGDEFKDQTLSFVRYAKKLKSGDLLPTKKDFVDKKRVEITHE